MKIKKKFLIQLVVVLMDKVKLMKVKHAVITSVDRDDLSDGGSEIWVSTVKAIRRQSPTTTLETLIPDFAGNWKNLQK